MNLMKKLWDTWRDDQLSHSNFGPTIEDKGNSSARHDILNIGAYETCILRGEKLRRIIS